MCLQQNDFFCHVSLLLGGTIVVNKLCFIVPLRLRHFYMWTLCKSVSNMCARMHKSAQMISRKQTTQLVTWYGKWVVSCCAADRLPHHLTSRHLLQLTRFIYLCIYSTMTLYIIFLSAQVVQNTKLPCYPSAMNMCPAYRLLCTLIRRPDPDWLRYTLAVLRIFESSLFLEL